MNKCLHLESTKPKSMLNKCSLYTMTFPVTCVCLSIVCEPPALFSCEYTLNGSHSAHITMRSEQAQPSQGNLFYTFTVY